MAHQNLRELEIYYLWIITNYQNRVFKMTCESQLWSIKESNFFLSIIQKVLEKKKSSNDID